MRIKPTERILVVDDEESIRKIIAFQLKKAGYETMLGKNGREGVEMARNHLPDLILLDLMMPEMDGFDFVLALRQLDDWPQVPIIVLTARDISSQERALLNGQVEKVLQKATTDFDELVADLKRLARHRSTV